MKFDNSFAVTCEGIFHAVGKKNRFSNLPDFCIPVSESKIEYWTLRELKLKQLLSLPDGIKELSPLKAPFYLTINRNTQGIKELFTLTECRGEAKVTFTNGNIYEGFVSISETEGFQIANTKNDLMTFKWANGDFWRGAGALVTADGLCIPNAGYMTYAGTTTEIGYFRILDTDEKKRYAQELYRRGKTPTEVADRLKRQEEVARQGEQAKEQMIEQRKQAAKEQADQQRKAACLQKYGQEYGMLVYQHKVKLGMTREMCADALYAQKLYKKSEALIDGQHVEVWSYDPSARQILSASETKDEAMGMAAAISLFGGLLEPEYTTLYFVDGELIGYE